MATTTALPSRALHLPIADHGVIGDMHTVAIVAKNGAINWWCPARFDAPSVFAELLDVNGGAFQIAPAGEYQSHQTYVPGTAILETHFRTQDAHLKLTDLAPERRAGEQATILRRLQVIRGTEEVSVRFSPRFNYARSHSRLCFRRNGIVATDGHDALALSVSTPLEWNLTAAGDEADSTIELTAGQELWFHLHSDEDECLPVVCDDLSGRLEQERDSWGSWADQIRYSGPYADAVIRSAITLRMLCYKPTGAIAAAATTSLPEWIGGERNWDYRYTWIRDASFTLNALHGLGHYDEARNFMRFVRRISRLEAGPLQIMFGVGGERELPEETLDHLSGYMGSSPVRIGNGAVDQVQMDVYGELLDAIFTWSKTHALTEGLWLAVTRHADTVARTWKTRDHGIWEPRTGPQHFVFSRVMCWVALDRAVRMARHFTLPGDVERWEQERDAIHDEVMAEGWSEKKNSFVMHYETDDLDAALLLIPATGFLPADHPRVLGTIAAIEQELAVGNAGLLYRYNAADGVAGDEGVFLVCSYWLADAHILSGNIARGREIFEAMLDRSSRLGLYAEELNPSTGELLGNFPQAYTHIALINTALRLASAGG